MPRFIIVILSICCVNACSMYTTEDEASYFYSVPVGSTLTLNNAVSIKPNQVAAYMQHGEYQPESVIDKYFPYCKFETYTIADSGRSINPDTFTIDRVVDDLEVTSVTPPIQVASINMVSDRPSIYTYATLMYLHSNAQPDVFRMTCMHWESIMDDRYLTVPQMREAMGDLFTLGLAQRSSVNGK